MKTLRGFAWVSTLFSFLIIFTGGLVRVSGAGLGCPDWPKCFGRWLPPTSVEQLPANIDPSLFNFTLAWIEYGNRLLGMLLGLLILVTAILSIAKARKYPRVWIPAVLSALLVAYVGWQGGQVVASGLEPFLVAIHLLLSLVIVLLLLYMSLQLNYLRRPELDRRGAYPAKLKPWLMWTFILALVQTALGTQLRGAIKVIQEIEPLGGTTEWINMVGPISHIHQMLGVVVAGLVMHSGITFFLRAEGPSPLAFQASIAMVAVATAQVLLGVSMLFAGPVPFLQVFHLWMTPLLLGSVMILLVSVRRNLSPTHASYEQTKVRGS